MLKTFSEINNITSVLANRTPRLREIIAKEKRDKEDST